MIILITPDGYTCESKEVPQEGRRYYLEDAEDYTPPMRKLWEALVDEAYKSGLFSYDTTNIKDFREHIKLEYGEGFNRIRYVDNDFKMIEVKSSDEIPEDILLDFSNGNRQRVLGVVKSSTEYTIKQMYRMTDNLIDAMLDLGVNSAKFQDILETISKVRCKKD